MTRGLLVVSFLFTTYFTFSQVETGIKDKRRWQHLDYSLDSVYGISMDRAYNEVLKGKHRDTVIVAVIDSGLDTLHPDLQPIRWFNTREHGNDEDRNGYKNDRSGWNFLGIKPGVSSFLPGFEFHRLYLSQKSKCGVYSNEEIVTSKNRNCLSWLDAKIKFQEDSASTFSSNFMLWNKIAQEDKIGRKLLQKDTYTINDINKISLINPAVRDSLQLLIMFLNDDSTRTNEQQLAAIKISKQKLIKRYTEHPDVYRAETIGDNYSDINDKFYGNAQVKGTDNHGTHVAAVVGAVRSNILGIDGIADAVKIMPVRIVASGSDEYDKDIALAIRYAVDNGAKVINMSFGKPYSPQREWVDDAIQYAAKKDVLIVHAAGNDAGNNDSVPFYPEAHNQKGKYFTNMITVGASGPSNDQLIAYFSNYGKHSVNVFAPGVDLHSFSLQQGADTLTDGLISGTSIASPVVTGLAAVIRSYYPKLSALQVKNIIESSVTKIEQPVILPGSDKRLVKMSELCSSGGIVNAYNALKLAARIQK